MNDRTPAARISAARAANSARLGSSRLCLVQLRTQRSGGGLLGGAVGRSTPGVRRAPRLPLPPPRLVVCSHAALLRGPPPRCVSCAGPLVVFSRLSSSVSRLRARSSEAAACCCSLRRGSWAFNARGVCLHAALLRVPRPRCASRAWPPRRFVRPAFAAGSGRVVRFVCQARLFF